VSIKRKAVDLLQLIERSKEEKLLIDTDCKQITTKFLSYRSLLKSFLHPPVSTSHIAVLSAEVHQVELYIVELRNAFPTIVTPVIAEALGLKSETDNSDEQSGQYDVDTDDENCSVTSDSDSGDSVQVSGDESS